MKIMYLNIFEGAKEKERLDKIISFVNKEQPDILALSELEGWIDNEEEKIKFLKEKTSLSNHFSTPRIAIFSKYPITESTEIKDNIIKIKNKINNIGI